MVSPVAVGTLSRDLRVLRIATSLSFKGNKVSRLEFIRLVKEWDPNTVDTNVDDLPDELPGESSTTTTSGGSSTEATPPTKKRKA